MSEFALSNMPTLVSQASAVSVTSPSDQNVCQTEEIKVDLRQALNFVIEEDSATADAALSDDEVTALEQRRLDLIMWLLNLELRLSPYTADFA
ncbi:MAG: hypothetical protein JSS86_15755 [Cyanobacteria bacterium SZAS LIN-2]|nr:hypothetical protein [Cyanobacteria bacterium SZAS LIN-2]